MNRWLFFCVLLALLVSGCGRDGAVDSPAGPLSPTAEPEIGVAFATISRPTAVIRQTTPTPLPPPTVTPTPTPILYEIAAGDTLLGIAIARGTTTEEIMALNPGIRPELLQIGQQLILPPPATPIFGEAAATPLPLALEITGLNLYETRSGTTWLLGEVANQGESWAENVRLAITMIGPSGESLGEAGAWASPALIPPGRPAFFALLWPGRLPSGTAPQVSVAEGRGLAAPGGTGDNRYVELAVEAVSIVDTGAAIELAGRVANTGGRTARQMLLTAALFQPDGQLTGLAFQALSDPLPPGGSLPFTLSTAPPGGTADRAVVYVQGLGE